MPEPIENPVRPEPGLPIKKPIIASPVEEVREGVPEVEADLPE